MIADLGDSLEHRFRSSGPYRNEAFNHLHQLGLKELADESGANDLGRSIRGYLIDPFQNGDGIGSNHLSIHRRHSHEADPNDEAGDLHDEDHQIDIGR